jgi:hypothetical protein
MDLNQPKNVLIYSRRLDSCLSLLLRGAADSRAKRSLAKVCGAAANGLFLLGAML